MGLPLNDLDGKGGSWGLSPKIFVGPFDDSGGGDLTLCLRIGRGDVGGLLFLKDPRGEGGQLSLSGGYGLLKPTVSLLGSGCKGGGNLPRMEGCGDGPLLDSCGEGGGLNFLLWSGVNDLWALLLIDW